MKIYLSHAWKDNALAMRLARCLREEGFSVWDSEEEINLGDNWAKIMGKALDQAELMVLLFTPDSVDSDRVRADFNYAIGNQKLERRVFSVYVGPRSKIDKYVPWILLKLPHRQVESARGFGRVVKDIEALSAATELSAANA